MLEGPCSGDYLRGWRYTCGWQGKEILTMKLEWDRGETQGWVGGYTS